MEGTGAEVVGDPISHAADNTAVEEENDNKVTDAESDIYDRESWNFDQSRPFEFSELESDSTS